MAARWLSDGAVNPDGMPSEDSPAPTGWWYCRVAGRASEPGRFVSVQSDRYSDGTIVELDEVAAAAQIADAAACTLTVGSDGEVLSLLVGALVARRSPPLWFAELRESAAQPPAVNLVAFTTGGPAAGSLLDESALTNIEISSNDQLGALRWYPATGEVDQVYVQPEWRRRDIAGSLLIAAGALSVARGWPRLWGDGQRTELGEQLRNASPWRHRAENLTHIAPPMTPEG